MKVDRNQNIQARQVRHIDYEDGSNLGFERIETIGGIPLRLYLAAECMPSVVACWQFNNVSINTTLGAVAKASIELADALIEAHNATCEEVAGE